MVCDYFEEMPGVRQQLYGRQTVEGRSLPSVSQMQVQNRGRSGREVKSFALRKHLVTFLVDLTTRLKRSDHTVESYARDIAQFFSYIMESSGGNPELEDWKTPVIRGYLHDLAAKGQSPA